MLNLWSKELLMASKKLIDWVSPELTDYGTIGGNEYGAVASGTYGSSYAWKAFNIAMTGWGANVPAWVMFYSPKPVYISYIEIGTLRNMLGGTGVPTQIQGSNDNVNFYTLYRIASGGSNFTVQINAKKAYKYIRFYVESSAGGHPCQLADVRIYGKI